MAGSVEEGDVSSVGKLHIVGADMLGDTAGFTGNHISLADIVEQRCLAVVDVTHHGHYRRTALEIFLIVFFLLDGIADLCRYIFCREAELFGHDIDCLGIKALVDRNHDTDVHTCCDNVVDRNVHHRRQLVGCNEFGDFKHLALGELCLVKFALVFGIGLAFFFTPLGTTLETLVFRGKTGKCLANLLLYIFLAHLGLYRTCVALVAAAVVATTVVIITSTTLLSIAVVTAFSAVSVVVCSLLAGFLDIYFFFSGYAAAFFTVAVIPGSSSGLARFSTPAIIFTTLLRACVEVHRRKVDGTYDFKRRCGGRAFDCKHFRVVLAGFGLGLYGLRSLSCFWLFLFGYSFRSLSHGSAGFCCFRLGCLGSLGRLRFRLYRLLCLLLHHRLGRCDRCFGFGCLLFLHLYGFGLGRRSFGLLGRFYLRSLRLGCYGITLGIKIDLTQDARFLHRRQTWFFGCRCRFRLLGTLLLTSFLALDCNLGRAVFKVFITGEGRREHVYNAVLNTRIGVFINRDVLFSQKFDNGRHRHIKLFRDFVEFLGHILFYSFFL